MNRRDGSPEGVTARAFRAVWPVVSLALAVVIAASPGAESGVPVAALLPVAVIFFWTIRRGADLPSLAVFASGLILDAMSNGPFGYWALVYLAVMLLARTVDEFASGGGLARIAMLAACLAVACGVQAGVTAAFGAEPADVRGMAFAGGVVLVVYPVLAWGLALGARREGIAGGLRFEPQGRP